MKYNINNMCNAAAFTSNKEILILDMDVCSILLSSNTAKISMISKAGFV